MTPKIKTRLKWAGLLLAVAILLALVGWRMSAGWAPPRDQYSMQGPLIGQEHGSVAWDSVKALGADFAYIRATNGSDVRDAMLADNLRLAKDAGMQTGAVHRFNLCRLANDQAANFITSVPRSPDLLPPAIELALDESCADRPERSLVISELVTLVNQIEAHAGKPAVLLVHPDFEALYTVSPAIERTLWVSGDFFPPDYVARSWVMWMANSHYRIGGVDGPVQWNVVK